VVTDRLQDELRLTHGGVVVDTGHGDELTARYALGGLPVGPKPRLS